MDFQFKLKRQKVWVTRPESPTEESDALSLLIEKAGGTIVRQPLVRLELVSELSDSREILADCRRFGSLVFVSANGAYFFNLMRESLHFKKSLFDSVVPVAIGPGTESAMRKAGFDEIHVCPESNSGALAGWLIRQFPAPFLIVRANRGSDVLANVLTSQKVGFREWVVYESSDVDRIEERVEKLVINGELDWITLTSSAIANTAIRLLGKSLKNVKIATLGKNITKVVELAGLNVAAEAKSATFVQLVAAMHEHGLTKN